MTILAGGSSLVSGMTRAGPQLSFALCATAVIAYNTMAATHSSDVPFEFVYISLAMLFGYRSVLNAARNSPAKSCGCSHAAKCPPLGSRL